jgi:hypothetical protein
LVEVFINNEKELSITGEFSNGSYGFYNYSQGNVLYSAIKATTTNSAPIAKAGQDQNITVGTEVMLDGTSSTDDTGIDSYFWEEGTNILSYDAVFSIDSLSVGIHTITLTVEDEEGVRGNDEVAITVNENL